ncbi:MAG TPA: succinate dehydrogenase, cytochrome b556 subunit [Caulobacterales bacterium]|nr:succinate dehydrogenase, cytochrome b556 subunit [Caulobacterales bacterium]
MPGAARPVQRPVSPHLSIWRWHITMAASILHRVTGVGLYLAAILMTVWLIAIASGPEAYAPINLLLTSWVGQVGLYLLVASLAYHFAQGVRHLVFDTARGLKPVDADASAWFAILFAIAAPIGLWAFLSFGR